MTIALLLKYWRELAIGALALALIGSCVSRDHRIARTAIGQERSRQADAVLRVVTPQLVLHDTLVQRDTVKVRVAIDRQVTLRDTLLQHKTDTVLVERFVTRADSVAQACSELSKDCAAFRLSATQAIAAWKAKAESAPLIVTRSCVAPSVATGVLSAIGGYVIGRKR